MSEKQTTACEWGQDEPGSDTWESDCGGVFTLNDGTPFKNRMAFCCYCGKPIKEMILEDRPHCKDGQPCADPDGCDANYCARETGRKFSEHFNSWLDAKRQKENQRG